MFARIQSRSLAAAMFLITAAATVESASGQMGMDRHNQERIEFTIDVAEDMNKFVEHRTDAGVEPVRGSQFVTEGRIYPAFSIQGKGEQFDPSSPGERGTWFCKGVFLVKGSEFDKSPIAVLTDQLFQFERHSITSAGIEGNGTAIRPVTGGTGAFAGYTGEQRQQFLGFNKTGGVNLRVTIILRKTSR